MTTERLWKSGKVACELKVSYLTLSNWAATEILVPLIVKDSGHKIYDPAQVLKFKQSQTYERYLAISAKRKKRKRQSDV